MSEIADAIRSAASKEVEQCFQDESDRSTYTIIIEPTDNYSPSDNLFFNNIDDVLKIKIRLSQTKLRDISKNEKSISFIDVFGKKSEFKYIFNGLLESTTLSKQEITSVLSHHFTYESNPHMHLFDFVAVIPMNCVITD